MLSIDKRLKIKILHVVRPAAGGIKSHLLSLIKSADGELFEVMVACPPGMFNNEDLRPGTAIFPINIKGQISPFIDLSVIIKLVKVLKSQNIDIVHVHGYKAGLLGRIAARLAGTKVVFLTVHNFVFGSGGKRPRFKEMLLNTVNSVLDRNTQCIIAVSQELKRDIIVRRKISEARILGAKIVTVNNGIDVKQYRSSGNLNILSQLGIPPGQLVGTVARLAPQKGIEYFVRAAAMVSMVKKETYFIVVGDGPLRERLEEEAKALNLKGKLFFIGQREDVPNILPLLEMLVIPSVMEGFGLVALEAMAASRPVVASRVGGLPEVVEDGVTGLLVPPGNAEALGAAILKLLGDEEKAREMGRKGYKRVQERFSIEIMARQMQDLYMHHYHQKSEAGCAEAFVH